MSRPSASQLSMVMQWDFVEDYAAYVALPVSVVPPLHRFISEKGKPPDQGIGLLVTGKEMPIISVAAHQCVWKKSHAFIKKVMVAEDLQPAKGQSLYEALKLLIQKILPGLGVGELAAIMSQRAFKSGAPGQGEIPEDVLDELFPEGKDKDDIQDWSP